jgi:hypothetical protein
MKAKYVRDHVSSYGNQVKKATNEKFGINNALIIRAVNGNEKALKEIGDMGKTGERLVAAMPIIRENLKAYIQGIGEYNESLADIYKTGGKEALRIDKSGGELALENTRYISLIEEYTASLSAKVDAEYQRHDDAWIDTQMVTVNAQANLESISNKPFIAQLKADEDYDNRKIKHLLENGSQSDLSLIPRKDFSTNPVVKVWNYIRNIF